jgi:hypothetical protein
MLVVPAGALHSNVISQCVLNKSVNKLVVDAVGNVNNGPALVPKGAV